MIVLVVVLSPRLTMIGLLVIFTFLPLCAFNGKIVVVVVAVVAEVLAVTSEALAVIYISRTKWFLLRLFPPLSQLLLPSSIMNVNNYF